MRERETQIGGIGVSVLKSDIESEEREREKEREREEILEEQEALNLKLLT